ncbi:MAG: hypothetical protein WBN75_07860 [Verrucomicrobiia bacterium]
MQRWRINRRSRSRVRYHMRPKRRFYEPGELNEYFRFFGSNRYSTLEAAGSLGARRFSSFERIR